MFFFGHLGIGKKLVSPFTKKLPVKWVLIGAVLPDLIDKPLYYGLSWFEGKRGDELGLISGTRTFGHTAILLLGVTLVAVARKSRWAAALALGITSHFLLDGVSDSLQILGQSPGHSELVLALFWPLLGWHFPTVPYRDLGEHLSIWNRPVLVWGEVIGAILLYLDYLKIRRFKEH